jgi:uncharacterized repeat protein (TIGR01451 family)
MKKILIPFIVLLFTASFCKAQYVNIPDSNFRSFLIVKYPSCFNSAKMMDTTCSGIVHAVELSCQGRKICNLEGVQYFKSIVRLICDHNDLASLPPLPKTLTRLWCHNNNLTELPELPNTLKMLICSHNNLHTLPNLPLSLNSLTAGGDNYLYNLPALPDSLTFLSVTYSPNLHCLPFFPSLHSTLAVSFDSTAIQCLPNLDNSIQLKVQGPDSIQKSIYSYLVCNPTNNVNQCQVYPIITGKIYKDRNSNGQKDVYDVFSDNVKIQLSTFRNTFTNSKGIYKIYSEGPGTYNLTIIPPPFYKAVPQSITVYINSYDTVVNLPDIALQPTVLIDSLSIVATPINWAARPGFKYPFLIQYENVGTTFLNSIVNFNYDNNLLSYDSSSNAWVTNSGSSLSLAVGNLQPGQTGSFIAYFKVKQTATLGDNLISVATINATNANAIDSIVTVVRGSYDPNDKKATPSLTTQEVNEGKYIYYTIRFQNTGNDTAFTVVIADTLSNLLQSGEVTVLASSHVNSFNITGNIAYTTFNEINLPDSIVDKVGSNGFIKFKVKPVAPLAAGTIIPNKAYIYFDYNKGIETNTASTIITGILPVKFTMYELRCTICEPTKNEKQITNYWTTETEENTSHFNVQSSLDGQVFKNIGTIAANGKNEYIFTDELKTKDQLPKTFYYRLEVVDYNGGKTYSEIKTIRLKQSNNQPINFYPNPAKNKLNITVSNNNLNNTKATLLNAQCMVIKTFNLKQGSQTIDITELANGLYILQTHHNIQKLVIN